MLTILLLLLWRLLMVAAVLLVRWVLLVAVTGLLLLVSVLRRGVCVGWLLRWVVVALVLLLRLSAVAVRVIAWVSRHVRIGEGQSDAVEKRG